MKEKMRLASIMKIPGIGVVASSAGYVFWVVRWVLDG